jgi:hypothetical protein
MSFRPYLHCRTPLAVLLLVIAVMAPLMQPAAVQAAPARQVVINRAISVGGSLQADQYHYLGLESVFRDGTVILTLSFDPVNDDEVKGGVNFIVLTEDGLRRVLAGEDPEAVAAFGGSPLDFDPIGNKKQSIFQVSGRGAYTVIVFNASSKDVSYTLTATNGVLLDDASQVMVITAEAAPADPSLLNTPAPNVAQPSAVAAGAGSPEGSTVNNTSVNPTTPQVTARRLSGLLTQNGQHFFTMQPAGRNAAMDIYFRYEPSQRETDGAVNFYLLDVAGLREIVNGVAEIEDRSLASGSVVPFQPYPNVLAVNVTASGNNDYTLIPYSESPISVTYAVSVSNALLVDGFGQTNEATAAVLEAQALANPTVNETAAAVTTDVPAGAPAPAIGVTATLTPVTPATGAVRLTGVLDQQYEHHYFGLSPLIRDGRVVITYDFAPKFDERLQGATKFWVLDEDGLRRVLAGARPEDLSLASGSEVRFGPDRGVLRATFDASGKNVYTVVIYNDAPIAADYSLSIEGGLLEDADGQALLVTLP